MLGQEREGNVCKGSLCRHSGYTGPRPLYQTEFSGSQSAANSVSVFIDREQRWCHPRNTESQTKQLEGKNLKGSGMTALDGVRTAEGQVRLLPKWVVQNGIQQSGKRWPRFWKRAQNKGVGLRENDRDVHEAIIRREEDVMQSNEVTGVAMLLGR